MEKTYAILFEDGWDWVLPQTHRGHRESQRLFSVQLRVLRISVFLLLARRVSSLRIIFQITKIFSQLAIFYNRGFIKNRRPAR